MDNFSTTNLYLVAHLQQLNIDYKRIKRHANKKKIFMFVYEATSELLDIIDDFHDNKDLQKFITNHWDVLNKIKRENRK